MTKAKSKTTPLKTLARFLPKKFRQNTWINT